MSFLVKLKLFNDFFREPYRRIINDSSLPNNQIIETIIKLSDFNNDADTIMKLIHSLDPNKTDGCNGI